MNRNATLDYARLLAAFGIVFFHAGSPGAAVGYAALPFFLLLLVVLALPGTERISFADYLNTKVQRLLMPWLIWSAVYSALKLAELSVTGAPFESEFSLNMLLSGPATHLWFLPFAFFTCIAIYPLSRLARRMGTERTALIMAVAGVAILLLRQGVSLPVPFAQWLYALPAVCIGVTLALVWGRVALMGVFLAAFAGAALLIGASEGLLQIVIAGGALMFCKICTLPATRSAHLAGALSLGVYLAHPLVLSVLGRTTSIAPNSLSMAVLGCLGGLAIAGGVHLAAPWLAQSKAGGLIARYRTHFRKQAVSARLGE
jgi:fucose 4-O-acetylase-like acetyltransferase